ncbi:MAG: hypothetical protein IJU40_05365 [Desulfovibrionaceae bacterium]|nr:hypothetical protein [Desulfovibrionaceae bacterium]
MSSSSLNPIKRLDKWLWQKGFGHPLVQPLVRNQILGAIFLLGLGSLLYLYTVWIFWLGVGATIMALTFFSLAHFFLHLDLDNYNKALLFSVLLRWAGRLLLTVCLLFVALVLCAAPVSAILAGLVCASILALVTFAIYSSRR